MVKNYKQISLVFLFYLASFDLNIYLMHNLNNMNTDQKYISEGEINDHKGLRNIMSDVMIINDYFSNLAIEGKR